MRETLTLFVAFFFCFLQLKASEFNLDSVNAKDVMSTDSQIKGIFDFIEPGKEQPMPVKEWTVMVFMNAKNDLLDSQLFGLVSKCAEKDIDKMKKVGTT